MCKQAGSKALCSHPYMVLPHHFNHNRLQQTMPATLSPNQFIHELNFCSTLSKKGAFLSMGWLTFDSLNAQEFYQDENAVRELLAEHIEYSRNDKSARIIDIELIIHSDAPG